MTVIRHAYRVKEQQQQKHTTPAERMHGSERRLHVYQNGTRTVVRLSETRLSSSSPDGFSITSSRHTPPPPADTFVRVAEQPREAWDTTFTSCCSPFGFAAFGSTEKAPPQTLSEETAEHAIASPSPRPPRVHTVDVPRVHADVPATRSGIDNNDGHKSQLLSSSASGVGLRSVQGLSQSPQTRHGGHSTMTSTTAPSTLSDAPLSRRDNATVAAGVATGAGGLAAPTSAAASMNTARKSKSCTAESVAVDAKQRQTLPSSLSSSSLVVSCDVSCITASPAERPPCGPPSTVPSLHVQRAEGSQGSHSALPLPPVSGDALMPHATTDMPFAAHGVCEKNAKAVQIPLSRRTGTLATAERVLFQGNEGEEDEEDGTIAPKKTPKSNDMAEQGAATPLQRPGADPLSPVCHDPSSCTIEAAQAHTPLGSLAIEQRASVEKSTLACASCVDAGNTSVNSPTCTCALENASSAYKVSKRAPSRNAPLQPCSTAPLHSTTATKENISALSTTAANLSSIAPLHLGDSEIALNDHSASHAAPQKSDVMRCCDAAASCGGNEEERTPTGVTAKVMPSDVEIFNATPTMTVMRGCEKTPTPTPNRCDLLRLLLAHAASATLHTPRTTSSCSAGPAATAASTLFASPQTPSPHPSRRLGSNTPSWEGLAQITGFPTPVKLSPIPTKGYEKMYPQLTTSSAALAVSLNTQDSAAQGSAEDFAQRAVMPCTPPEVLASPTLSSIGDDEHLPTPALPPALRSVGDPAGAVSQVRNEEAAVDPHSAMADAAAARLAEASQSARFPVDEAKGERQSVTDASATAAHTHNTSSECLVSPIHARAEQTTRVWTPHLSDVSQTRFPSSSSMSCVSCPHDGPTGLGAAQPLQVSHAQPACISTETVTAMTKHADPAHSPRSSSSSSPSSSARRQLPIDGMRESSQCETTTAETTEPQLQSSLQRSPCTSFGRSALGPDLPRSDAVAAYKSVDPSLTGHLSPRLVADTLILGTPTVSIIYSPAQALNQSCSFLLPPATTTTPYFHALPVPGMPSAAQPARKTLTQSLEKPKAKAESSFCSSDSVADQLWLCPDDRRQVASRAPQLRRHAPLMSPAFEAEGDTPLEASAPLSRDDTRAAVAAAQRTPTTERIQRSCGTAVSISAGAASAPVATHESVKEETAPAPPQPPAFRVTHGTQTSCLFHSSVPSQPTNTAKEHADAPAEKTSSLLAGVHHVLRSMEGSRGAVKAPRGQFFSSLESLPHSSSHSWSSAVWSHRYQRLGMSSTNDGGYAGREESHSASYQHTATAKSLSSTRFIDSWL